MPEEQYQNHTSAPMVVVKRSLLVFILIMSLIMGIIGGAGSVYILANSSGTNSLGIKSPLTLPVTQQVTLEENSKFIDVAKQVSPSVVSVASSKDVMNFFGQTYQQQGGGTGFVVSNDGLIATNKHVVSDSGAKYSVTMSDGSTYDATIVAVDPFFDFALIKISAKNLKPITFGDSDQMAVGQWVMVIGNALAEFQNSVTVGVISAKERNITAGDSTGSSSESLEGLIQTDAAINPGDSGGPMLNLAGQVIGINTATSFDAQNIGFAIPINVIKPAVDSYIKSGRIIRPALGVRYMVVNQQIADAQKLPVNHGALIQNSSTSGSGILSGSPADKAGLKVGDIVTAVNGQNVDENHSLSRLIQQYAVGASVKVSYYRDGKEQTVNVTLEELKK